MCVCVIREEAHRREYNTKKKMPDIIFVDDNASFTSSIGSSSRSKKYRLRRQRTINKLSQFLNRKKSFTVKRKVSEDIDASYAAFCHAFTSAGQTDIVPEWQVLPGDEDSVLPIPAPPFQAYQHQHSYHHHHQSPPIPQAGTEEEVVEPDIDSEARLSSSSHHHSWNRGHWEDDWQAHPHTKTSYPGMLPSRRPSPRLSMSDESTVHTLSSHSTSINNVPSLESDDHESPLPSPTTTPSLSPFYCLPTLPEKPHAIEAPPRPRVKTLSIDHQMPRLSRRKSMWEPLKTRLSQLRQGRSTRECTAR